jgi:transposase
LSEGVEGLAAPHALVADNLQKDAEPDQVVVGIETDRGPWVSALIAAGYTVYAINPRQVARYRERHGTAGAKSDPGDAHVLTELVRLDRAHHRPVAGDSALAEHVNVLTRTYQSMIWSQQRQTNALRSMLREFHPATLAAFGEDLAGREALAILAVASSPEAGRRLSQGKIVAALRRAGRQRGIDASAERISAALRAPQLEAHSRSDIGS